MDITQSWKAVVELKVFWQMIGKHHSGFSDLFSPTPYSSQLRDIGQEIKLGRKSVLLLF